MKIEHLGIATNDLAAANELYARLLGRPHYKIESVESEGVTTSFFRTGESKVELLEASTGDSAIAKYLEKRGPGIHHIAFGVKNIHREMERLRKDGFRLLNETPKRGADNKLVCFIHPKSTGGVLVELCQDATKPELRPEDFPTVVELPVQWGDMDAADHVNNAVYFRYLESARIEFFRQQRIDVSFAPDSIGPILGWQECKYVFPLTFPDTALVGMRVLEVRADRLRMQGAVFSKQHERLAALSEQDILPYDYDAKRKVELPDSWRRLEIGTSN